ncbi:hypothetical protein [Longimicrobium sp.]|uniref:hypothetical protein n=1 Tax=Longimicrobium sp. TaxID=2029185 RepID=UPI002D106E65|nr:hypothetical protein [Longimicrobium sp.]HSU15937.1 hypothetical protein [Longimicrobium sp.]
MKTRIIAAVFALAALAGCDHNPFAAPEGLVGTWQSDTWTATFPIPSGATPGTMREFWSLAPAGTYSRHTEFWTAAGAAYTTYVETGTWGTEGDELVLTALMAAENPQPLSAQPLEPRLIKPRVMRSVYAVAGTELTLSPPCSGYAICDGPSRVLHRVLEN